ncbi:hypothetical protein BJV78DRAFT_1286618 [Lactifluus subvellereus]|nr:hypothetical protein BJV78DRAFT_1286618 [Lactifluus subvellereus]
MPLKNKRACQAKTQRVQGGKFFKRAFIDNLDNQNDYRNNPDWVNEEDSDLDSEFDGNGGWAVSISEAVVPDLLDLSDSEDKEAEIVEQRNGEGGTKRKAAVNQGEESDEGEEGAEESEAHQILSGAEAFWKGKFSKAPPPLTHKGSYTGTSHANIFKKQATLCRAAAGSAKIDGFFALVLKPTRQPIEVLIIESSSESSESEGTPSDSGEEGWVNIPTGSLPLEPQLLLHSPATPVPGTPGPVQVSDVAELLLLPPPPDNNLPNNNTDPAPPAVSFLNPTADDEFGPEHIPTGVIVAGLIKDATKHKAFGALFKLHAVRNYLGLHERYRLIPNVKNPAMRASLTVAKSVGKGPYLARQIQHLVIYIDKFHTLPPSRAGKHHAHPSLLNNERVYQAVRRYLTVQEAGMISPIKLQHEVNKTIIPCYGSTGREHDLCDLGAGKSEYVRGQ